ncbi:MAG: aminopeptidase [Candidatus Woesearchaeota archaeon]
MPISMQTIVDTVFTDVLKIRTKDRILIICDRTTKPIAESFLEYGYGFGKSMLCVEIPVGKHHGEEPPAEIAELFLNHDVLLLITQKSLSHTNARKKATRNGARILTMPSVTPEILKRCVPVDYNLIAQRNKKIAEALQKATWVRVTSPSGTDIRFKLYTEHIAYKIEPHKKGGFHNLPIGEAYAPPKEGTAEGVYVVDGSHAGVGLVKKPIRITVAKGYAVSIEGGKEAKQLHKLLSSVNHKHAFNIAELGIGTNPRAKITGCVLEDEKVYGTCHIALGNNYSFGGKVNVPIHLDGVIQKPTIYADDRCIMKNGKLL